ncbi:MAG: WecB/TagA/CpsF family glycosyltransferase [Armatimonadetes bacterium]|nr:WecB/TagA/CpsF family glycosyltransferase [Armatimonadota bacterium]
MAAVSHPGRAFPEGTVMGFPVAACTREQMAEQVCKWAVEGTPRSVFASAVHFAMEARDHAKYLEIAKRADAIVPDGVPLVWALRKQGFTEQPRVAGPDLLPAVCEAAAKHGIPVGFYGGTEEMVETLAKNMAKSYPKLKVAYVVSPPFRKLTEDEDRQVRADIVASGAKILFVGLGCPTQEAWIDEHRDLPVVKLGLGAAFAFHAGMLKRAPKWMQKTGTEWVYRLVMEPRRLFMRYFRHNPRFLVSLLLRKGVR